MRAIIPVAGVGSRLRPHTFSVPKVLLNVAGKPILGHILDKLLGEGITEASIVVGYMGEQIREYVGASYPSLTVDYIEQDEALGLGHAIYLSRSTIGSDPVLIILGDTIFDVDLRPVLQGSYSSLGVKKVEDPRRFGVAQLRGEFIEKLIEKPEVPASNLAVVGLYFLRNPQLLARCLNDIVEGNVRTKGEFQLTDALQRMIDQGERMTTFDVEGWYDCGKPETLIATNRALLEKRSTFTPMDRVVVIEPVFIAPTASIENSVIGPNTTVGENAVIRDAVIRDSIIGADAQVRKSLLENSLVGPGAVVRGSFKRVNVGDSSEIDFT